MHLAAFLLACASSLITCCLAQSSSACSGQQYNSIPGFPASNSGCYPLGYYQTSDLGQTSPTDAQSRCQQQCTNMGSQCGSVVAQVNKAADSNLYPSGTCFFFAPTKTPTGPRQCADTAYLLEGYMKDSTLACFASSTSSATKFCSSYLSIPVYTATTTTTPSTATITATVTSMPTTYVTSTVSATSTVAVTSSTTLTTTVATTTSTQTSTATFTTTATVTLTVTAVNAKRAASTIAPPACVSSNTPATRLSAACSCLSVPMSTTTKTVVASQPTTTVTMITTVPVTSTQTTTVTSATVTTTNIQTYTVSTTATTVSDSDV